MIAVTVSFLCSALVGLRLTFMALVPLMLAAAVIVFALHGALVAALSLAAIQAGYVAGVLLRAFFPARIGAAPLRRPALR